MPRAERHSQPVPLGSRHLLRIIGVKHVVFFLATEEKAKKEAGGIPYALAGMSAVFGLLLSIEVFRRKTILDSTGVRAFGWFGLVTSSGGFVYGQVPTDNPGGAIGTNATYPFYYLVANATPGSGDKPFATKLSR